MESPRTQRMRLSPLTRQLLAWLAAGPRTYDETMAAWRTHCPRLAIWEDALADGLICIESGSGLPLSKVLVKLSSRGQAALTADPAMPAASAMKEQDDLSSTSST